MKVKSKIAKETEEEKKRKIEYKKNDIKTIREMILSIDTIMSSHHLVKEDYVKLAKFADKITRFGKDNIRTIYSNIENGINWKDIYHIKVIAELKSDSFATIIPQIALDLPLLKNKLIFILKDQESFIQKYECDFEQLVFDNLKDLILTTPLSMGPKLSNIEKYVSKEYNLLILEKIFLEAQVQTEDIDFIDRANRYYLARKFFIIGELLNELPNNAEFINLIESLKKIIDIRDGLIHRHSQLLRVDSSSATLLQTYTQRLFTKIITALSSLDITDISLLAQDTENIYLELEKLKPVESKATPKTSTKTEIDQFNKLISKAHAKFSNPKARGNIEQINDEYMALRRNIPSEQIIGYPISIDESNKKQIAELSEKIKIETKQREAQEEQERLEAEINVKKREIAKRVALIDDECNFLKEVDSLGLSPQKKSYISHHATNVIAESMEQIRNTKAVDDFTEVASSVVKASQRSSMYLRKNGLSHDLFSFDTQKFDQILSDEILPAHKDISSMHNILNAESIELPYFMLLNRLGVSYTRLGLYTKAIENLLKSKEALADQDIEVQNSEAVINGVVTRTTYNAEFFVLSLGVDLYTYKVIYNLADAYILRGSIQEGKNLLEDLISKINFENIKCITELRDMVAVTTYRLADILFRSEEDKSRAKILHQKSYELAIDDEVKFWVSIGHIFCLRIDDNAQEAKKIKDSLNIKVNQRVELYSMLIDSEEAVMDGDLTLAAKLVEEASLYLKSNIGKLRDLIGDRTELLPFLIIQSKLMIEIKGPNLLIEHVNEIENEIQRALSSLKSDFKRIPEIGDTYLHLSNAYIALFLIKSDNGQIDNLSLLEAAEKYLLMAQEGYYTEVELLQVNHQGLSAAYAGYASDSKNCEYFEKALSMLKEYSFDCDLTYTEYGFVKSYLADEDRYIDNVSGATVQYLESINLINKVVHKTPRAFNLLGVNYEQLGNLHNDVNYIEKAISAYSIFLSKIPRSAPEFEPSFIHVEKLKRTISIRQLLKIDPITNSDICFKKTEQKVLELFAKTKQNSSILKIYGVKRDELDRYFRIRLGGDSIEIKELLSKKGFFIQLDERISSILRKTLERSSLDASNLKRLEKHILSGIEESPLGKLQQKYVKNDEIIVRASTRFFSNKAFSGKYEDKIGKESQTFGTIAMFSEVSHTLYHKANIMYFIRLLNDCAIQSNTVICLERKQFGNNLGMSDIVLLAEVLESSTTFSNIIDLPIYYDALLYNAAQEKGISIVGIEGKGLVDSKESPYYHQAREEYMAEQLVKIAKSGKNAIFLVGAAHTRNLIKLLGAQGFRVDNSDISLGQNLITLKTEQAIFARELALLEVNTDLVRIANYEHRVEDNSQLEKENFVHETIQSYSFLLYINEFAEQFDLNWQVQKLLHLTDLWKFEVLKAKYKVTASFDIFKETNSNFIKSVLFKLHPDKNPGIKDCNEDFVFVTTLREELNKPFYVQKLLNEKIQAIQPYIYKANIGLKVFDTAIDVTRLTYVPTAENAKKFLIDTTYLYSMYSGINSISTIINGADIACKVYQGEYSHALTQTLTTAGYMLVPAAISFVAIPYVGFVYGAALTVYSGYGAIANAYSFYQEYYEENFGLRSITAYKNFFETLSYSPLQYTYDFLKKAKEYEVKFNNINLEIQKTYIREQLEGKGEFGQKLYEYIYSRVIEEKYDLENKILQGILTQEEADSLTVKHIKLLNYYHCMEVIELKEKDLSDHYYCYNVERQILDHIVITGETNIEKISSL
jgi:hypothetical protein